MKINSDGQLEMNLYEPIFVGVQLDKRLKQCNKCGERKSVHEFGRDRRTADGYANTCRDCRRHTFYRATGKKY